MHDAWNGAAMFGAHDQDVPTIAIGDDLVLEILRRVAAAEESFKRLPKLLAMRAQPRSNREQRWRGMVGHLARRVDLAADVGHFRGKGRDTRHDSRKQGSVGRHVRDRRPAPLD